MNKEINELDRMVIGVREWAVDSIWTKGMGLDRWIVGRDKVPNTKIVLEEAAKLEEYVMRGLHGKIAHCWATGSTQEGGFQD